MVFHMNNSMHLCSGSKLIFDTLGFCVSAKKNVRIPFEMDIMDYGIRAPIQQFIRSLESGIMMDNKFA